MMNDPHTLHKIRKFNTCTHPHASPVEQTLALHTDIRFRKSIPGNIQENYKYFVINIWKLLENYVCILTICIVDNNNASQLPIYYVY